MIDMNSSINVTLTLEYIECFYNFYNFFLKENVAALTVAEAFNENIKKHAEHNGLIGD